jgi:hypothetical protein
VIAFDLREHLRQRIEIGQVAMEVLRWILGAAQAFGQLARGVGDDIDEEYLRALLDEGSTIAAPMPVPPPVISTRLSARLG